MRRRPPVRWLVTSFGAQAAAADDMRRRPPVRGVGTRSQPGAATPNPAPRTFLVDAAAAPQSRLLLGARVRGGSMSRVASVFVAADFVTVTALDAADWDDGDSARRARARRRAWRRPRAAGLGAGRRVRNRRRRRRRRRRAGRRRARDDRRARAAAHARGRRRHRLYGVSEGGCARAPQGACVDCPSSTVTLRFAIRNLLCHKFPGESTTSRTSRRPRSRVRPHRLTRRAPRGRRRRPRRRAAGRRRRRARRRATTRARSGGPPFHSRGRRARAPDAGWRASSRQRARRAGARARRRAR